MPQILKDTIVFNSQDFLQLLPNWGTSNAGNQKGTGIAAMRSMNPFRQYGQAAPGYNPTDATNVSAVDSVLRQAVISNDGKAIAVSSGAKIHQLTLSNSTLNASPFSITAHSTHTTPVADDCVVYNAKLGGTSAYRMFYSWSDNTDWDVGTYNFSTTTSFADASHWDDDFMSTAPATPLDLSSGYEAGKGYPHPLLVGDDDLLYIGDRNFVHAYDGQNSADNDGKFFPAQMTLPYGFIVTSFAKLPDALVVFAYKESVPGSSYFYYGQANAYFYRYGELDPYQVVSLNDNIVTEAFNYKGTIGCFTQGRAKDPSVTKLSQLLLWNGSTFDSKCTFMKNPPIRGGVDVVGDAIYWNSDGVIHSYGSPLTGTPAGLLLVAEGAGTTSGLLRSLTSSAQYASTGTTTSGGLQLLNSDYYSQPSFATGLAEPIFPYGFKGKVMEVKTRFAKASTGGRAITIQLRDRYTGSSTVISEQETVSGQEGCVVVNHNDSSGDPFINFDALKLVVSWAAGSGATDAPILDSVEVRFQPIKV